MTPKALSMEYKFIKKLHRIFKKAGSWELTKENK